MTNDFFTALADIGVLLILLLIASLITGAIVFVVEAFRRRLSSRTDSDASSKIANSRELAAAPVATTNAR